MGAVYVERRGKANGALRRQGIEKLTDWQGLLNQHTPQA
jgi:hypothetical protein